jgi:hypothetical protein
MGLKEEWEKTLKNIGNAIEKSKAEKAAEKTAIAIPLPEALINSQLQKAFGETSAIRSVQVKLLDGYFEVDATVNTQRGLVNIRGDVEISRFSIDQETQIIELNIRGTPTIEPEHWLARVSVSIMSVVLKLLFGKTLLEWGAKDIEGVQINGSLIRIDLGQIGATNMIEDAIKSKMGVFSGLVLPSVKRISVVSATPAEGFLTVRVARSDE